MKAITSWMAFVFILCQVGFSQSTATVEISGDAGWRMLSGPISGFTVSDISDDTPVQGITGGASESGDANFYIYPDLTTPAFTEPTDVTTAFGDGYGFILYFFDNSESGSQPLPVTLDATGSEPGSNVTVNINDDADGSLDDGDFTMVGNPFNSNFSLDDLSSNGTFGLGIGGLSNVINVWSDSAGTYISATIGDGEILSKWQGFWAQSVGGIGGTGSASTITFPTAGKTTADSTIHFFNKSRSNSRLIALEFRGPNNTLDKAAKLYFHRQATEGKDSYDGGKLTPLLAKYITLGFVSPNGGDKLLSQDGRPYNLQSAQEYILEHNSVGLSGEFEISWPVWENIPQSWEVMLHDLATGEKVNMRQEDSYKFAGNSTAKAKAAEGSYFIPEFGKAVSKRSAGRFKITVTPVETTFTFKGNVNLLQNYPNPFNPTTQIQFQLKSASEVVLEVYNILGAKVATLLDESRAAGTHTVPFDGTDLSSGVYFYTIQTKNQVLTQKMTLLK